MTGGVRPKNIHFTWQYLNIPLTLAYDLFSTLTIIFTFDGIFTYTQCVLFAWTAGHQGSSLFDPCKTMGFKLLTCSPLLKGRDHSPPKAFLEESSTWLNFLASFTIFSVPDVDHDTLYPFFLSLVPLLNSTSLIYTEVFCLLITSLPQFVVSKHK